MIFNDHDRVIEILKQALKNNYQILNMIEEILCTECTEGKTHLDMLSDKLEGVKNENEEI